MGTSYQTRAVIGTGIGLPASGGIIREEHLNQEFTAVIAAFNSSSGHEHDGSDSPFIIKTGPAGQLTTAATNITPSNATFDLGTSAAKFQNLFLSGTATIDTSIKTPVIADTGGNEAIKITTTSNAVNEFTVVNAATGNDINLSATGGDTNVSMVFTPKGSGLVKVAKDKLAIGGTAVTTTAAELNVLDGDVTNPASVTLAGSDGVVISDSGVLKQALISDITTHANTVLASSTQTLTNKTFDANGTNNSITNLEVADFATGVLDTDLSTVATGDTTLASAKAIKTYVDAAMPVTGADYGSASNPHVIVVTVATKTTAHPYYGSGSSLAYFLDGVESPVLELNGHDQTSGGEYYYKFDLRDSSVSGHHLVFYEDAAKTKNFVHAKLAGTSVTFGSGTAGDGTANAWTMIKVSNDTPNKLYYQCNAHAFMGNHIKTGNLSPGINDHHTIEMGNLILTNNKISTIDNNSTGSTNGGHSLILDTYADGSGNKEPIQADTWMKVYGNAGGTSSYVTVGIASGGGDDVTVNGTSPSVVINDLTNDATTDRGELLFQSKADDGTTYTIGKIQGYHKTQTGTLKGGFKIQGLTDSSNNYIDAITIDGDGVGLMNTTPSTNVAVDAAGTGGFLAKKYVETVKTLSSASTVAINFEEGNVFFVEAATNITFTFSGQPANADLAYGFTLKVKQDSSGSHTLTWPSTVRWPGGTAPSLTGTAASIDVFTFFTHNGGGDYYGFLVGSDLSGSGGTSS